MTTATIPVTIATPTGPVEAHGIDCGVPGLCIATLTPEYAGNAVAHIRWDQPDRAEDYSVTHAPSGHRIRLFARLDTAREFARRIGPLTDWTRDMAALQADAAALMGEVALAESEARYVVRCGAEMSEDERAWHRRRIAGDIATGFTVRIGA